MKKILGLSIAALMLIALVTGGTIAYFTDVETSAGNLFVAGTIDLAVNNQNPWTARIDTGWVDFKPGQPADAAEITLKNVGTNPMDVWLIIKDVVTAEGENPEPEGSNTPHNIDTVIDYYLKVGITVKINYTQTVSQIAGNYIYLGALGPNKELVVNQSFRMKADTENWAQGDTMAFTVEFFAQQSEGDPRPPAPTPELPDHGRP